MKVLRTAIFALAVVATARAAAAEAPPCSEWGGVLESQDLYFVESSAGTLQSALVNLNGRFGSSWLQAQLQHEGLRFENKMPGLGIPSTIYHAQVEWLAPNGQTLTTEFFPEEGMCAALSLFPGQSTFVHELKRPVSKGPLRLKVKIWAVTP